MKEFAKRFEKTFEELEKLDKKWIIKGIPKGHERIWAPKNEVKLWSIKRNTAELLKFLVVATKSKTILELGTSAGYSTLWLAYGAKINKGKVYTVELFEPKIKLAREHFKEAMLDDHIIQIHGEINKKLENWKRQVDFVFMDANKHEYLKYTKMILPHLKKGGIIAADNAINHAHLMKDFLEFIKNNKELESCVLNIDDGLLLAVKK